VLLVVPFDELFGAEKRAAQRRAVHPSVGATAHGSQKQMLVHVHADWQLYMRFQCNSLRCGAYLLGTDGCLTTP
jgi:hypothetical protein